MSDGSDKKLLRCLPLKLCQLLMCSALCCANVHVSSFPVSIHLVVLVLVFEPFKSTPSTTALYTSFLVLYGRLNFIKIQALWVYQIFMPWYFIHQLSYLLQPLLPKLITGTWTGWREFAQWHTHSTVKNGNFLTTLWLPWFDEWFNFLGSFIEKLAPRSLPKVMAIFAMVQNLKLLFVKGYAYRMVHF